MQIINVISNFFTRLLLIFSNSNNSSLLNGDYPEVEIVSTSNSSLFRYIPPRLTHVVIPFHPRFIPDLKKTLQLWNEYLPCTDPTQYEPVQLVFLTSSLKLPGPHTNLLERHLFNIYNSTVNATARACFANDLIIKHTDIPLPTDDSYLKATRLTWEKLVNNSIGLSFKNSLNFTYAFLMEIDVRPIRPDWLLFLTKEIGHGNNSKMIEFKTKRQLQKYAKEEKSRAIWIRGSIFRGTSPRVKDEGRPENKYHINGNAIYQVSSHENANDETGTLWEFYVGKVRPHIPLPSGYDSSFWFFLFYHYDAYRSVAHRFQYTNFIQNHWTSSYSPFYVRKTNPSTFLIHGGYPEDDAVGNTRNL